MSDPSMTVGLVERLQAGIPYEYDASEDRMVSDISGMDDLMSEAADRIAVLEAALNPLRDTANWVEAARKPEAINDGAEIPVRMKWLRAARNALEPKPAGRQALSEHPQSTLDASQ